MAPQASEGGKHFLGPVIILQHTRDQKGIFFSFHHHLFWVWGGGGIIILRRSCEASKNYFFEQIAHPAAHSWVPQFFSPWWAPPQPNHGCVHFPSLLITMHEELSPLPTTSFVFPAMASRDNRQQKETLRKTKAKQLFQGKNTPPSYGEPRCL